MRSSIYTILWRARVGVVQENLILKNLRLLEPQVISLDGSVIKLILPPATFLPLLSPGNFPRDYTASRITAPIKQAPLPARGGTPGSRLCHLRPMTWDSHVEPTHGPSRCSCTIHRLGRLSAEARCPELPDPGGLCSAICKFSPVKDLLYFTQVVYKKFGVK